MKSQATTADAFRLLMEGSKALSQVEASGIKIDLAYLDRAIHKTERKIKKLREELETDEVFALVKKRFGDTANLGSRVQLGEVLFGDLGLPVTRRTAKEKRPAVDDEALKATGLPWCLKYLRWQQWSKTGTTSLQGIKNEVVDGLLHPFEHLHTTTTGRSSSGSPNLHNFPTRDPEFGKLVRRAFVPRPGRRIVENDFKGAEVRVGYCVHRDPAMYKYLTAPGTDMHLDSAVDLYGLTPEEVSKALRYDVKANFVFAQFYGSYYVQCAPRLWAGATPEAKKRLFELGVTELGACDPRSEPRTGTFEKRVRDAEKELWQKRFPVYAAWKRTVWERFQREGELHLVTGFRCGPFGAKGEGKGGGVLVRNDVTNYYIQGPSFHCLLWCLIELVKELRKRKMKALVIGQIHDSILGDVPDEEVQDYLDLVTEIVTERLPKAWKWITVPLEVEAEVTPLAEDGGTWWHKAEWVRKGGVWGPK